MAAPGGGPEAFLLVWAFWVIVFGIFCLSFRGLLGFVCCFFPGFWLRQIQVCLVFGRFRRKCLAVRKPLDPFLWGPAGCWLVSNACDVVENRTGHSMGKPTEDVTTTAPKLFDLKEKLGPTLAPHFNLLQLFLSWKTLASSCPP